AVTCIPAAASKLFLGRDDCGRPSWSVPFVSPVSWSVCCLLAGLSLSRRPLFVCSSVPYWSHLLVKPLSLSSSATHLRTSLARHTHAAAATAPVLPLQQQANRP
ncbi:unnamed protein product, partial [Ectocarpus sp. 4 AP-2014]